MQTVHIGAPEDFKYSYPNTEEDGTKSVMIIGLSALGKEKLFGGASTMSIPEVDVDGNVVDAFGMIFSNLKDSKNLRSITDWGNVRYIFSDAFSETKIERIPESWKHVEFIGPKAFFQTLIEELPDDWSGVDRVGGYAFANYYNLFRLPEGVGAVRLFSQFVFSKCNITRVPMFLADHNVPKTLLYGNPLLL